MITSLPANTQIGNNFINRNEVYSCRVVKLLVQKTGTYNQMYYRPFSLHANQGDINNMVNRVSDFGHGKINGSVFSGLTSNIIAPVATPEKEISIPYGWGEERLKFVLIVDCIFSNFNSKQQYIIQGYTDYAGMHHSISGTNLDDNMNFIINSVIGISYIIRPTPNGNIEIPMINDNIQILENPNQTSLNSEHNYLIRPFDVAVGLQTTYLQMMDVHNTTNIIDFQPKSIERATNIPGEYLGKIIDSYVTGTEYVDQYGSSGNDLFSRVKSDLRISSVYENPVLRFLSNIATDNSSFTTIFQLPALRELDSNIHNVINIISNDRTVVQPHRAGETAYWRGSDRDTLVATILVNSIPSLMMELMIKYMEFTATNQLTHNDLVSIPSFNLVDKNAIYFISAPLSLAGVDLTSYYELFKRRFIKEIMNDISYNNTIGYYLHVSANIFGEIKLNFSIGGDPMIEYVTPSAFDGLYAPVISSDLNHVNQIVNGFNDILNTVSESIYDNHKIYNPTSEIIKL